MEGNGAYTRQVRLASEIATVTVAIILLATAALPTVNDPGLVLASFALLVFALAWFHLRPPGTFGRQRFVVGVLVVQAIFVGLIETTGGPLSPYFVYYTLPALSMVFDLRWRATLIVGAAAVAGFTATWLATPDPFLPAMRDVYLVRTFGLASVVLLGSLATYTLMRSRATIVRQEAAQRELIGSLRDPVLVIDAARRITHVNPAARELFGRERAVLGTPLTIDLGEAGGAPATGTRVARIEDATGRVVEFEVDRMEIGVLSVRPSTAYMLHDVSKHTELSRLREQLLYSVAHELRGPLGVLESTVDILATEHRDLLPEEIDRVAGTAQRTARRLRSLMEDLLSAGAIQAGRFKVMPERVALRTLVDDAFDAMQPVVEERSQRLELDLSEEDVAVSADRRYAPQVLVNLITNASKYSPDGTVIRVCARPAGEHARFVIEDRGRGIPKEEQAGLFDRFYRPRGDGREPGIGLGLAIARGIVEAHGGDMGLDSRPGQGTRVWFTLPLAVATSKVPA